MTRYRLYLMPEFLAWQGREEGVFDTPEEARDWARTNGLRVGDDDNAFRYYYTVEPVETPDDPSSGASSTAGVS